MNKSVNKGIVAFADSLDDKKMMREAVKRRERKRRAKERKRAARKKKAKSSLADGVLFRSGTWF